MSIYMEFIFSLYGLDLVDKISNPAYLTSKVTLDYLSSYICIYSNNVFAQHLFNMEKGCIHEYGV